MKRIITSNDFKICPIDLNNDFFTATNGILRPRKLFKKSQQLISSSEMSYTEAEIGINSFRMFTKKAVE
jgi:hypothetical protein